MFVAKSENLADTNIQNIRFSYHEQTSPSLLVTFDSTIQRYMASPTTIHLSKAFQKNLDPNGTEEQPPDLTRSLWTRAKSVSLTSSRVESLKITSLQLCDFGEWMLVGFNDGTIKQLSVDTLDVIATCEIPTEEEELDDEEDEERPMKKMKKVITEIASERQYATSIAISPNSTCFAALQSSGCKVAIFVLSPQDMGTKEEFITRFELNILNYGDQWDLLILLKRFITKNQVLEILSGLEKHRTEMQQQSKGFYAIRYERLFMLLNRFVGEERVNQVVNTQANIFIMCFFEALRSHPLYSSISAIDAKTGVENMIKTIEQGDPTPVRESLSLLLPLTNWVVGYTLYLFRNVKEYVERVMQQGQASPTILTAINPLKNRSTVVFLRDAMLFTYYFVHVYQTQPTVQASLQTPLLSKDQIKPLFTFMWEIWSQLDHMEGDKMNAVRNQDYLKNAFMKTPVQMLTTVLATADKQHLLTYLDLLPQYTGLLGKKTESKKSEICFDVITRTELRIDQIAYRVCKTCSRVCTTEIEGFGTKWTHACPMCAGYWCIQQNKKD